jgi:hypothetical protein
VCADDGTAPGQQEHVDETLAHPADVGAVVVRFQPLKHPIAKPSVEPLDSVLRVGADKKPRVLRQALHDRFVIPQWLRVWAQRHRAFGPANVNSDRASSRLISGEMTRREL